MFSARIKGRALCYASSHSDFHEHLWSHDADKVCHWEGYITQTTNIERIHAIVLSLYIILDDLLFVSIVVKALLYGFDPYI